MNRMTIMFLVMLMIIMGLCAVNCFTVKQGSEETTAENNRQENAQ